MAGTPIDLSAFKPVAGQPLAAAPVSNAFTAIEAYTGSALDPASMLQKAATIGQVMQWNGTLWAPGQTLIAPTMLGPSAPFTGSVAALTANTAYLAPVPNVVVATSITSLVFNVASGSGANNVDAGIYYVDGVVSVGSTWTRLASTGSITTPSGSPAASLTGAPIVITPVTGRRWYFAFACNSATPTFQLGPGAGNAFVYSKASSFPLPATITGITGSNIVVSMYGWA